jgi:hypothetical protein
MPQRLLLPEVRNQHPLTHRRLKRRFHPRNLGTHASGVICFQKSIFVLFPSRSF